MATNNSLAIDEQQWAYSVPSIRLNLAIGELIVNIQETTSRSQCTEDPLLEFNSPFATEIQQAILPQNFVMPQCQQYTGYIDLVAHVKIYRELIGIQGVCDGILCKFFPLMLTGSARRWYEKMKPRSICSFSQLCGEFLSRFKGGREQEKDPSTLFDIKQGEKESNETFINRFHQAVIQLGVYNDPNTLKALIRNTCTCRLWRSFRDFPPKTYSEAHERALNFLEMDAHKVEKLLTENAKSRLRKARENPSKQNDDSMRRREWITRLLIQTLQHGVPGNLEEARPYKPKISLMKTLGHSLWWRYRNKTKPGR